MLYTTNIIFLDFDGVLTSTETGTYFNPEIEHYSADKDLLDRLVRLCNDTDSKIVIASNWRKFDKNGYWKPVDCPHRFYNPLPKLYEKLGDKIIGTLPLDRHITKSQALELWFEYNELKFNYVIFDDEPAEGYAYSKFKNHYIETDRTVGLSEDDYNKAKEILMA